MSTSTYGGAAYRADDHVVQEHEEAGKGNSGHDDEELDAGHVLEIGLGLDDGRLLLQAGIWLVGEHRT